MTTTLAIARATNGAQLARLTDQDAPDPVFPWSYTCVTVEPAVYRDMLADLGEAWTLRRGVLRVAV